MPTYTNPYFTEDDWLSSSVEEIYNEMIRRQREANYRRQMSVNDFHASMYFSTPVEHPKKKKSGFAKFIRSIEDRHDDASASIHRIEDDRN